MRVVVTGSNGFIGQHLCRRFARDGWDVRAAVRADVSPERIDALMTGAAVVVHAAGATRAPSDEFLEASNAGLTKRVAEAARRAGVQRFVFVSSQAAAGPARSLEEPVTEAMEPSPVEAYGRSKLAAERAAHEAWPDRLSIVRPSSVYGPGCHDFLELFRLASRGVAIHPGNKRQWISIVHVSDVVDGIARAATATDAELGVYFLANDAPVTWDDCFKLAASCAGRSLAFDLEVPRLLVDIGAAAGDAIARITGRTPLLSSHKAALAKPPYWVCSNARAKRELGFAPSVPLEDGFRSTYSWYVDNGWLGKGRS